MSSIQGSGIFLTQFLGGSAPFDRLDTIASWVAVLGDRGLQISTRVHTAFKQLCFHGSVGDTRETWSQTIRLLKPGKFKVGEVITYQLPQAEGRTGFELWEQKKAVKVLLYPG